MVQTTQAPATTAPRAPSVAQAPASAQSQVGNAGVAARAGATDPATGAPASPDGAPVAPSTTVDVQAALNAVPFTAATVMQQIAGLARSHPGWPADCWNNAAVMTLMTTKFNGDQMYQVLQTLGVPGPGGGRVVAWVDKVVRAHQATGPASAQTYTNIVSGAGAAELAQLLAPGNLVYLQSLFAMVAVDPLTLFPALQAGLSAEACASAEFVAKMVERSAPNQIWRAVKGTSGPNLATLAGAFNAAPTGWAWLDSLDAAALPQADRDILTALHATANAPAQAKIVIINATAGVATPGVPFATALTALQTAAPPPAALALRAFLQTGTAAERVTAVTDAATAAWLFSILTDHPLLELSVQPGDAGSFMAASPFFLQVFNHAALGWMEKLSLIANRTYLGSLAALLDANAAVIATWITTTLPAKAEISAAAEADLRAVRLASTAAGIAAAIVTKFGDTNYDGTETQTSAPVPATVYQTPLEHLDALLAQPAPPAAEVLSMIGALSSGADRTTVTTDAARMDRIRNALDEEHFYQALVDLELPLATQLTQLRQKGHNAARLQSVITRASAADRLAALADDANMTMCRTDLPVAPAGLFGAAAVTPASFANAVWAAWVLETTPSATLLPLLADTAPKAAGFAACFDGAVGWGFLARTPDGPGLAPTERTALENLMAGSATPAIQAQIRAKLDAGVTPAVPAPAPAPAPGAPVPAPIVAPPSAPDAVAPAPADPAAAPAPAPAPAPTPLQALQAEITSPTAAAARFLQLANVAPQADRNTVATAERARIIALLGMSDLARFVGTITGTLAVKLGWLRDKTGTVATGDLQTLLAPAPAADKVALFDDAALLVVVKTGGALGPLQTLQGLDTQLATLATKVEFWRWALERCTSLDILAYVGTSGAIPAALAHLTTLGRTNVFDSLPVGTGLSPAARGHLDAIMTALTTELALGRQIFQIRYNVPLTGPWAAAAIDDIRNLYNDCKTLPIMQVANNPKLRIMNRGAGGGGTYSSGTGQINVNQDDPNSPDTMYAGTATPVTERYFDHTVRHEIGHSVDAMLGSRTALVFGTAGWKEYGTGALDQWITQFDGWNPGGGAAPTDPEKGQIRDLVLQLLHSGGGAIDGSSTSANDLAAANHPFKRFPMLKVVDVLSRGTGTLKYTDRYTGAGKVFSINYYYRRFMECTAAAGASVPRDYCMFSPAEWFADMYAEFYRQFNGTDDGTLGGNCPGWVKTWMLANVHNVGGRTPQDLHGQALPPGQRAGH